MAKQEETLKYWEDVKAHGVDYNTDILLGDKKIHYSDLLTNDYKNTLTSYIKAAKTALNMGLTGLDEKYKVDDAQIAADPQLAKELITDARNFVTRTDFNFAAGFFHAFENRSASAQEQVAFMYLRDVHERLSMDWTSPVNFLKYAFATDPLMIGAFAAGWATGHTTTAAAAAAKLATVAGQQAVKQATVASIRAASQTGLQAAWKEGIKKGVGLGLIDGGAHSLKNASLNSTSIDLNGTTFKRQDFWTTDILWDTGMGGVGGGAFALGGHYLGKAFSGGLNNLGTTWNNSSAKQSLKNTSHSIGATWTNGQAWFANKKSNGSNAIGDAWDSVANGWYKLRGATPPPKTPKTATATAAAKGVSGIDLPEFNPTTDWIKHLYLRRNLNPRKLFTNWAPLTAATVNSEVITRPVIRAVDSFMDKKGILKAVRNWQDDVLKEVAGGGDGSQTIKAFSAKNLQELKDTHAGILELKNYVDLNYKPLVADRSSGPIGKYFATALNATYAIPGFSGGFGKHNITPDQKAALLRYLDDMADLVVDLQNPAGKNATQMLDNIAKNMHKHTDFDGSMNGLSKAYYDAHKAYNRLTKKMFDEKTTVSVQWRGQLEREIQEGSYNGYHPLHPIRKVLGFGENLEMTWQNNVLEFGEKHVAQIDPTTKQYTNFTWDTTKTPQFFGELDTLQNMGFGSEALYAVEELIRRRQIWGGGDRKTLPTASQFKDYYTVKNWYNEFLSDGVTPNPQYSPGNKVWADALIKKAEFNDALAPGAALETPFGHFVDNRQNRHFYAARSYKIRMSLRHPGTRENLLAAGLALPGIQYFYPLMIHQAKRGAGFIGGAKSVVWTEDFNNALPKYGSKVLIKSDTETYGAVARRIATRIGSFGILDDLTLKPLSGLTTNVYLPLAGVGLGWELFAGDGLSWDKRDELWDKRGDFLAYNALQIGMIPAKTILGAGEGLVDDLDPVSGAKKSLAQAWADIGTPTKASAEKTETTSLTPAATNPGAAMTNSNSSNNTATSPAIPLPVISASPDEQQARQVILALGRGVSDLHSAAARDGWTDENRHKLAELQANHLAYAPKAKEFGGHAEDIVKKAGNALSHTLEPNAKIDTRPPENTSPFQTQQEARLNETMKLLAAWQNGLVTLNNDIAKADTGTNGWTDERKKKLAALETSEKAFARDVFFLAPEQQKIFSDASNMQFLLLQAKESDQPVAASFISLLSAPKAVPSTREAPSDKGHIKPPAVETAVDDTAEKTEKKADLKEKKEKSANAETFNNETSNGGASARTVSHGTDDGSFFGSVGGHAKDLANSFKRMTKVDDGDEITNAVSSTIGLFGAAGEKGAGLVGNTYDRLMAKQDRSGRSLIREVGAGILALVGMGSLFGPMLDRLGIGTIPIVGTLAKLATAVVVFMAARKGVDSVLPDVTPYAGQHVLQASSADRTRTHLPTLTQEEMNSGNVISMSNRGGPARTNAAQSSNRDRDVMQTASGNNTYVSADASSTAVHTGNVIHHPANLVGARERANRADAVLHGVSGGNVIPVDFKPRRTTPSVDGNLALEL